MRPDPVLYYAARIISCATLALIAGGALVGALPLIDAALLFLIGLSAFGAYLFLE